MHQETTTTTTNLSNIIRVPCCTSFACHDIKQFQRITFKKYKFSQFNIYFSCDEHVPLHTECFALWWNAWIKSVVGPRAHELFQHRLQITIIRMRFICANACTFRTAPTKNHLKLCSSFCLFFASFRWLDAYKLLHLAYEYDRRNMKPSELIANFYAHIYSCEVNTATCNSQYEIFCSLQFGFFFSSSFGKKMICMVVLK